MTRGSPRMPIVSVGTDDSERTRSRVTSVPALTKGNTNAEQNAIAVASVNILTFRMRNEIVTDDERTMLPVTLPMVM
jgi:hypothetical protein